MSSCNPSSILYGYIRNNEDRVTIDKAQAKTISFIYGKYLEGYSLGKLSGMLAEMGIPSPTGKDTWSRAALDRLLSNWMYVPHIIDKEQYIVVQLEKERRSNIDLDNGQRKSTRYNSQHVLSGLLICEECSANYRRITRPSGEVVWRCANRVEHGKVICKHSPSISEIEVMDYVCRNLDMQRFDEQKIRKSITVIHVQTNGSLKIKRKPSRSLIR